MQVSRADDACVPASEPYAASTHAGQEGVWAFFASVAFFDPPLPSVAAACGTAETGP